MLIERLKNQFVHLVAMMRKGNENIEHKLYLSVDSENEIIINDVQRLFWQKKPRCNISSVSQNSGEVLLRSFSFNTLEDATVFSQLLDERGISYSRNLPENTNVNKGDFFSTYLKSKKQGG